MPVQQTISKHGQDLTYRHFTASGTYNPATGQLNGTAFTDYTLKGYFFNFDLLEIDGTSVARGDRKLLIYAGDLPKPSPGDTFTGSGDKVSVVSVREVISRGSVLVYILQVRE